MSETIEQKTFCQICRHPSHVYPGHMVDCPVYTGEMQRAVNVWPSQAEVQAAFPQAMQGQLGSVSVVCPHCGGLNGVHVWAGSGECPGISTHPGSYPQGQYTDIDPRILVELQDIRAKMRRLQAALDDLRRTVAAKRP